ncbi:carbohydrate kinase family protein, partial [Candidatus Thorarchaeota archaeon]
DIAVGSEDFGAREFGIHDPVETIAELRRYGVSMAGVTLGHRGSLVDWGDGVRRFRAVDVPVVDTTGAGDIYHAALAYGALRDMSPSDTVTFASIAASLSCRSLGARAAIPTLNEIAEIRRREGSLETDHAL